MEWSDQGLVLGVRKHGENSVILELMTPNHGRHLGLVRGGRSRRLQPVLQPGNTVLVTWRARLEDQLGAYTVEPETSRAAAVMESAAALYMVQTVVSHLRLLPEREPHKAIYNALGVLLDNLDEPGIAGTLLVRLEMVVLEELGFGLDLSRCAATGQNDALAYVSPRTGRAVSASAGEPWQDKLLRLPAFMLEQNRGRAPGSYDDLLDGLTLTDFFFARHVYTPRGQLPIVERDKFCQVLQKLAGQG